MPELSEAALRLMEVIGLPDGPRRLFDAWNEPHGSPGCVTDSDLRGLLPDAWMRIDRPEEVIGTAAWVQMFRAAGFVSQPTSIVAPTNPLTVYRGAPESRRAGMAWSLSTEAAGYFRQRCERFGENALVYTATVPVAGVLALFGSRNEQEAVVDPGFLADLRRHGL